MAKKYKAFISYSHTDEQWAKWLQNALERYRVPKRLIEAGDSEEPLPKRLYPVFRDRSELASSSDLGASLKDALRDSEFLVVVCSPAAAKSRWLNEEVRFFRSQGRGDRILCFMVDGSPDARKEDCAFPPDLVAGDDEEHTAESLAADPRDDGKRDALLKIVAGILGVGIDDLKQRDAQRRIRWLGGIATVSAAIAIAMVFLAVFAIEARNEAELRRDQAEDLIGFMLGDLRTRLEPIGKLELLDAVGDEAMRYFEALDDNATAQDLFSRAMALRQIGEVRYSQRYLEPALLAFIESRSVLQRLHEQEPDIDDYLFELGQSEFWVGYIHYERSNFTDARATMDNYMAISQDLLARQPDNPDYLSELAYAYSNLGAVARSQGDRHSAVQYFRESALISEEQLEEAPGNTSLIADVAGGYSWIGSAEQDLGNLAESEDAYRKALALFRDAFELENDARTEDEIAEMHLLLAYCLLQQGRVGEALEETQTAYASYKSLVVRDPENARWRRGAAESARDMGELSYYLDSHGDVARYLEESLALYQSIVDQDASDSTMRVRYAAVLEVKARSLADAGDSTRSEAFISEALQALDRTPDEDRDTRQYVMTLASTAITHHRIHHDSDDEAVSTALVERAYANSRGWTDSSLRVKALHAILARLLGETQYASDLEAQLVDVGYAHPEFRPAQGSVPNSR